MSDHISLAAALTGTTSTSARTSDGGEQAVRDTTVGEGWGGPHAFRVDHLGDRRLSREPTDRQGPAPSGTSRGFLAPDRSRHGSGQSGRAPCTVGIWLPPAEPIPPSPFLERLFQGGIDYEADVVAEILRLHREAVVIDGEDAEAHEAATIAAMRAGLSPILNARLPVDLVGRRVGKPDLLVAAVGGGCRAADVKWHQNLEPALGKTSELPGRCSSLGDPAFEDAAVDAVHDGASGIVTALSGDEVKLVSLDEATAGTRPVPKPLLHVAQALLA
jgi:hypothetical protein